MSSVQLLEPQGDRLRSNKAEGDALVSRLRELAAHSLPFPAYGETPQRHQQLMEIGREDLSLARLAEAHFDALAILAEGGREPCSGALYGVWAAEVPGHNLTLAVDANVSLLRGAKMFCSGAGIVDRALVTVAAPDPCLVEIDMHSHPESIEIDMSGWKTKAFAHTNTATLTLHHYPVHPHNIIDDRGWYLSRAGFWHGACGPAACWAGGAAGLVDFASRHSRHDPHTLAHLGAMRAAVWQMQSSLEAAGREIDLLPCNVEAARVRALTLRHVIEQACTEILTRFARAYGPFPLAFDQSISNRYHELDIYLRQSHGERDLEVLGTMVQLD